MKTYLVSLDGRKAMEWRDEPGFVTSTARNLSLPSNPIISGHVRDVSTKGRLDKILGDSATAEDFLTGLKADGFDVIEIDPMTGQPPGRVPQDTE